MKKDKDKCKKGKESTIGKIIYGFLLFLPLMAIGVTCSYAIFNKNAYKSYKKEYTQQMLRITSDIQNGETYYIDNIQNATLNEQNRQFNIYFSSSNIDWTQLNIPQDKTYIGIQIRTYADGNSGYYIAKYLVDGVITNTTIQYDLFPFNSFSCVADTNISQWSYDSNTFIYQQITSYLETEEKLKDIFYYSVDKVENSNLFNWAENSVIYTGMNEFTTSLSITNTFIPLLLTYWLIISLVYFIYDIVLIIFNVLHRKIHELQDSI